MPVSGVHMILTLTSSLALFLFPIQRKQFNEEQLFLFILLIFLVLSLVVLSYLINASLSAMPISIYTVPSM